MHPFAGSHFFRKWGLLNFQGGHLVPQPEQKVRVKPCPYSARINQFASCVVTEQQGTEPESRSFRICEAAEYELLLIPAFEFQPVARARGDVDAVRTFCHYALETFAASLPEIRFTAPFAMIRETQWIVKLECLFQQRLSMDERNIPQVVAVQVQ